MSFNPILTRVLIHDPNPLLAESICKGLDVYGPFTTKASSDDLSRTLPAFRPNVVVLDPRHLATAPEGVLSLIAAHLPNCEVLAYVGVGESAMALRCLAAGFAGAVSQSRGIEALVEALTVARLGGVYVDRAFAPGAMLSDGPPPPAGPQGALSSRERFVLEQVARGFSNKEIALRLGLSPKTVETHRSRAAAKLGLRRKSDIVQYALRNDWLGAETCSL